MPDGRVAVRSNQPPGTIVLYSANGSLDTTWFLGGRIRSHFGAAHQIQVDTTGGVWLAFFGRPTRVQNPSGVTMSPINNSVLLRPG